MCTARCGQTARIVSTTEYTLMNMLVSWKGLLKDAAVDMFKRFGILLFGIILHAECHTTAPT